MGFFHLLRENHYDWDKAKDIFLNLTDLQIAWINAASDKIARKTEKEANDYKQGFGKGKGKEVKKSFNLRG